MSRLDARNELNRPPSYEDRHHRAAVVRCAPHVTQTPPRGPFHVGGRALRRPQALSVAREQLLPILPPRLPHACTHQEMVRSTIIVRAADALPLAATVDDEQVRRARLPPELWGRFVVLTVAQRQRRRSRNTSNKQNSSSGASHQTQSHDVPLRAGSTRCSTCLTSNLPAHMLTDSAAVT